MNKQELMKTANEIRKGIVTAVHSANPDIRADPYPRRISIPIYFLKK